MKSQILAYVQLGIVKKINTQWLTNSLAVLAVLHNFSFLDFSVQTVACL